MAAGGGARRCHPRIRALRAPVSWGSGQAAIADGTHIALLENNLLGAQHVRYGRFGGLPIIILAIRILRSSATLSPAGSGKRFILDGLLKNRSALQPTILHADTHGQVEPVFGLAVLGIDLSAACARGRTSPSTESMPTRPISISMPCSPSGDDWDLIARHWQDMMQVVLSIRAGHVVPSMLLRKLGVYSRHSALYKAFSELGRCSGRSFS